MQTIFYIILYFIFINLFGFFIMLHDKKLAFKHKFRISEKSIFVVALIGGSLGIYIGMYTVRHKTKHLKFTLLIPIILTFNMLLFVCIILKLYKVLY